MTRRSGRRKGKGNRRDTVSFFSVNDLKLTDFADNPSSRLPSRLSKRTSSVKYDQIKMSSLKQESEVQAIPSKLVTGVDLEKEMAVPGRQEKKKKEELAWDERDWDEEEDDLDARCSHGNNGGEKEWTEEEDSDEEWTKTKKNSKKKSKKRGRAANSGVVYPPILWFLIADYIRPEEIMTFACLCQDSNEATKKVTFWRRLYHRHFNPDIDLPTSLQHRRINKNVNYQSLRDAVIRALYLMYEPFRLTISTPSPVGEGRASPDSVTYYTCMYVWTRGKIGGVFTYFLKMRQSASTGALRLKSAPSTLGPAECILKVHCEHFQNVPSARIMGLQLVCTAVSVSAGNMRLHRVRLVFGCVDRRGYPVKSSLVTVTLDPVMKVEALHWWHPQFSECSQHSVDRAVAENAANARERNHWDGL